MRALEMHSGGFGFVSCAWGCVGGAVFAAACCCCIVGSYAAKGCFLYNPSYAAGQLLGRSEGRQAGELVGLKQLLVGAGS